MSLKRCSYHTFLRSSCFSIALDFPYDDKILFTYHLNALLQFFFHFYFHFNNQTSKLVSRNISKEIPSTVYKN